VQLSGLNGTQRGSEMELQPASKVQRKAMMHQASTWEAIRNNLPWLPGYMWQRLVRRAPETRPIDLIIGMADHFEPPRNESGNGVGPAGRAERNQRVKQWCRAYPPALDPWRDHDGQPFRHTYFYPAEQYDEEAVDLLVEHCRSGWGEIEIHLHHGVKAPDTLENTRRTLVRFRDNLVARGCLSRENGVGSPRYCFVHGNWALANSAQGRFCGVDGEMQVLADTGCYADFTLPAPSSAQISKSNALYECALPLNERAPHRRGYDLCSGRSPKTFPLIVQGPLLVDLGRANRGGFLPSIENSDITGTNPPTMRRLGLWQKAGITVLGRPEWLFIKLHCHGMADDQEPAMFGDLIQQFLKELIQSPRNLAEYRLHFVTMREMVNIILAACDGRNGNPGEYRDYRFRLIQPSALG
jgi:hypothetical protein